MSQIDSFHSVHKILQWIWSSNFKFHVNISISHINIIVFYFDINKSHVNIIMLKADIPVLYLTVKMTETKMLETFSI